MDRKDYNRSNHNGTVVFSNNQPIRLFVLITPNEKDKEETTRKKESTTAHQHMIDYDRHISAGLY